MNSVKYSRLRVRNRPLINQQVSIAEMGIWAQVSQNPSPTLYPLHYIGCQHAHFIHWLLNNASIVISWLSSSLFPMLLRLLRCPWGCLQWCRMHPNMSLLGMRSNSTFLVVQFKYLIPFCLIILIWHDAGKEKRLMDSMGLPFKALWLHPNQPSCPSSGSSWLPGLYLEIDGGVTGCFPVLILPPKL